MEIREIKATEHIIECWDLLQAHRDELATLKHIMKLKPDEDKYRALEDAGMLFTLALYDGDKIVGYSVNIMQRNLHYSDLLMSFNDILYVRPDLRKGSHGVRLIRETEREAAKRGARLVLFHGKEQTPFAFLMLKLGYAVQDIIFSKEIE